MAPEGIMNFPDEGNDLPVIEILATDIMISSTGGTDCALNVWILASRYFLMFCKKKKMNTFQKTYHMHYVGKISIHINYLTIS